jgi:hypothetical protein
VVNRPKKIRFPVVEIFRRIDQDKPNVDEYLKSLAASINDPAGTLRTDPPPTPVGQTARQALANRAVERLRRAIAAGFRDVVWVRTDTDLGALRARDDVQALIHDMVFPADPFAH